MMIKLQPRNSSVLYYEPPIPVTQHFGDVDTGADSHTQVNQLLWIPVTLVSRFLGQFPFLANEADELFSIGLLRVVSLVDAGKLPSEALGMVCFDRCKRDMEDYCNNLNSVVRVCTTTRYENKRRGRKTPRHQNMISDVEAKDNHDDLEIRDACEVLGYKVASLSLKQKRKLYDFLTR